MRDNLVMRSVYLTESEDATLRQMSHETGIPKSEIIREAISEKVVEWRENPDQLDLDLVTIVPLSFYLNRVQEEHGRLERGTNGDDDII